MNQRGAAHLAVVTAILAMSACVRDDWSYDASVADVGDGAPVLDASADVPTVNGPAAPPRPLAPLSLGGVTQLRPTLRWALSAGHDGAEVQLCRDRACGSVIETLTATGSNARPTRDLPPRSVVFWRLRGRGGGATAAAYGPTWLFHVPATSASTGVDTSASPHLDVNGDGYDDVAVGAYTADPGGRADAGTASVFHGSATGPGATAAWVHGGVTAGDRFGVSVSSAGDVNGDGYGDLIVGATGLEGMPGSAGSASVFLGGPTGLRETALRVFPGVAMDDGFGSSVAGAGDVDGDGYADVIVGAYGASPGGRGGVGSTSVYLGSASGTAERAARVLEGTARGERFGYTVTGAGDVDGDGYSDVAVTAVYGSPGGVTNAGTVSVFLGSASGIPTTAARVLRGGAVADQFGNSLACAGDVNGDGYSDLVVGANGSDPGGRDRAGTASVFHGSSAGVPMTANRVLEGVADLDYHSYVAGAGDLNGDGFGDLIVGANGADPGGRDGAGAVSVYHGSTAGIPTSPVRVIAGTAAGDGFGFGISSAGDVDGDGYADVVVGAFTATRGGRATAGEASVFHGSAAGIPATPAEVYEGEAAGDRRGVSVAMSGPRWRHRCARRRADATSRAPRG
ncbi:MAG: VCBS repeat-containing protein [Deltaproteobacteria bacterium]|nr:VCBS repeat-containing protein [Myxococcales bacterium]MDP3213399.1 VCBS repeat-containing protein [Deltaproteobacteria bacterium]